MAFDPELAIRQLIEAYRRAYLQILERIAVKSARGSIAGFEHALLADVTRILQGLDDTAREWAAQVIPRVYQGSAEAVYEAWVRAGLRPPPLSAGFARVHQQAVQVLVETVADNLSDAHMIVGRRVRDAFRRAGLEATLQKVSTGETVRQAKRGLQERLAAEGLTAFRDRSGRVWRLDSYAEMVARSTTAEATNAGTINQLRGMGRDLVQITSHDAPCPVCAPLEGRIYSISGEDKRFPRLDVAFGEYLQIHPNCRHSAAPYIEELADDVQADIVRSNRPFDVDPRTAEERRRYDREQRQNALRRERRRLEQQVAVLPPGEEREKVQARLSRVRSEQQRLGREQREYLDAKFPRTA